MTSNSQRKLHLLMAILQPLATMCLAACTTMAEKKGSELPAELLVDAKVVMLQGACNAINCPEIQYELAVYKILRNSMEPNASESDYSVLKVCGDSGLKLGGRYRFLIEKNRGKYPNASDRPRNVDGTFFDCDFVFKANAVAAAPA